MRNKTVLTNKIRIVSEEITHVRSVSIGIWVQSGSRYETNMNNGCSHFIEHMLFKGTKNHSAFDIAATIDSVGGILNAFTGKELTAFYAKVPDYYLPQVISLLADIFHNSLFAPGDIDKEKSVVLQEISMVEDSPEEYVHDLFEQDFWGSHPLGLSILGSRESVENIERETLMELFASRYRGSNMVIAAAGNVKHEILADLVRQAFEPLAEEGLSVTEEPSDPLARITFHSKNIEQVQVVMGMPAPAALSPLRFSASLINAVLGGSMSSRLFQEIREKRGLAYSINSFLQAYRDVGLLGISFGSGEAHLNEIISVIMDELKRLCDTSLSAGELQVAKEQLKGGFLLGMESTDARMIKLAKNEISFERIIPFDEILEGIEAITSEDIRELACRIFRFDAVSMTFLGSVSQDSLVVPWLQ